MPFHSIITANYNYRPFLRKVAESVLEQTDRDFEWIIVDDGSTDGSREELLEIEALAPDRIKILLRENGGQAEAFNTAFRHASGTVVSFLDSDDWWYPEKLEWVRHVSANRACCMFQHNLELHDGINSLGRSYRDSLEQGDCFGRYRIISRKELRLPEFTPTTGLSFTRDCLEKVFPIPVSFRVCADGFLTRTAFCHGEISSTLRNLGCYRSHGQNAVLGSGVYHLDHYVQNQLIPSLNSYYRAKAIPLFFDLRHLEKGGRGPFRWLQLKLTQTVVKSDYYSLRRIYPMDEVVKLIMPKRTLVVRSDRNEAALAEIRGILPDSQIDWLISDASPEVYRNKDYADRVIEFPASGNLDLRSLPKRVITELERERYDLVLYTCVNHGDRNNVRRVCRSINAEWFGYRGRGFVFLEGWDSLRLRRLLRRRV
ncbi:glycosyltransferase [Pelagicoccus albus]|uniref:Glycosyltransferase n=1 Tax=Pelagicoccus albus TaxID=415222 RepID=A0A7X1E8M5_9BACT|nr:glycosyltransferase [Pelagicoccus albus]MBC2606935.1 glycosyltransferase [Pelagicoccus albus]